MKAILSIILILSLAPLAYGGQGMGPGPGVKGYAGGGECTGYLICQNFEGAGYDNSETWTEVTTNGTVDEDYTATVLRGSQSLQLTRTARAGGLTWASYTENSTVHWFVRFRFTATPTKDAFIFLIQDSSGNNQMSAYVRASLTMRVTHGSVNLGTSGALTADTTYYLWGTYTAGTGANGTGSYWLGTTSTKPGTATGTTTIGTSTANAGRVQLQASFAGSPLFDQILVKTTEIGNVPD